jgi:hypothetical protein
MISQTPYFMIYREWLVLVERKNVLLFLLSIMDLFLVFLLDRLGDLEFK